MHRDSPRQSLGDAIWSTMEARGISAGALAKEVGVSRSTVYRWKDGERPDVRTIAKLAKALGRDRAELLELRRGDQGFETYVRYELDEQRDALRWIVATLYERVGHARDVKPPTIAADVIPDDGGHLATLEELRLALREMGDVAAVEQETRPSQAQGRRSGARARRPG